MMRRSTLVLLVTPALLSCEGLFTVPERVEPLASEIAIVNRLASSSSIDVLLRPVDESFRLDNHEFVRAVITTSGGDRELVDLTHTWNCWPEERDVVLNCFELWVGFKGDAEVQRLKNFLGDRATFRHTQNSYGDHATIRYFEPRQLDADRALLRTWSSVAWVDLMGILCAGHCDLTHYYSQLGRPVRVRAGNPKRGDGIVQVAEGDVIAVQYGAAGLPGFVADSLVVDLPD